MSGADRFAAAARIADAVLYEGYVLYPYRGSAQKNRLRWQFGVVAPRAWCDAGGAESAWLQTECVIEDGAAPRVTGRLRFLHAQRRTVEVWRDGAFHPVERLERDGAVWTTWDEAVEVTVDFAADSDHTQPFAIPPARRVEELGAPPFARLVRERAALQGELHISLERHGDLRKLRVRADNTTPCHAPPEAREAALASSLIGAHLLLAVEGGRFVSLVDAPAAAQPLVAACENVRCWPVLAGPRGDASLVLSSPIILYDHPQVAPESAGDLYDATEIDEILTLRVLTLTGDEQREARATDPRAAAVIDRAHGLSADALARMHGAARRGEPADRDGAAWIGQRVILRPGRGGDPARRRDAQDMFLAGRAATVRDVRRDVEDRRYLAVTVDDDPGADLRAEQGRYFYFDPDEVDPCP